MALGYRLETSARCKNQKVQRGYWHSPLFISSQALCDFGKIFYSQNKILGCGVEGMVGQAEPAFKEDLEF